MTAEDAAEDASFAVVVDALGATLAAARRARGSHPETVARARVARIFGSPALAPGRDGGGGFVRWGARHAAAFADALAADLEAAGEADAADLEEPGARAFVAAAAAAARRCSRDADSDFDFDFDFDSSAGGDETSRKRAPSPPRRRRRRRRRLWRRRWRRRRSSGTRARRFGATSSPGGWGGRALARTRTLAPGTRRSVAGFRSPGSAARWRRRFRRRRSRVCPRRLRARGRSGRLGAARRRRARRSRRRSVRRRARVDRDGRRRAPRCEAAPRGAARARERPGAAAAVAAGAVPDRRARGPRDRPPPARDREPGPAAGGVRRGNRRVERKRRRGAPHARRRRGAKRRSFARTRTREGDGETARPPLWAARREAARRSAAARLLPRFAPRWKLGAGSVSVRPRVRSAGPPPGGRRGGRRGVRGVAGGSLPRGSQGPRNRRGEDSDRIPRVFPRVFLECSFTVFLDASARRALATHAAATLAAATAIAPRGRHPPRAR